MLLKMRAMSLMSRIEESNFEISNFFDISAQRSLDRMYRLIGIESLVPGTYGLRPV
jgi:hypothetical protein